jgi:hypothetical protein
MNRFVKHTELPLLDHSQAGKQQSFRLVAHLPRFLPTRDASEVPLLGL